MGKFIQTKKLKEWSIVNNNHILCVLGIEQRN